MIADVIHAWNEQLITTFHVSNKDSWMIRHRKPKKTEANAMAQKLVDTHPIPSDVGFIFVQRAAVVIGKLSPGAQEAKAKHSSIRDGDLHPNEHEKATLRAILEALRADG